MTPDGDRVFVLLHGIGGTPADWTGVVRCLAPLGEVRCPQVPRGSLAQAADQLLAQAAADERVVLVGHSRGGVLALMLAARRPIWVDRVVLTGGYVPPTRGGRTWVIGAGSWVKHRSRLTFRFVRGGHLRAAGGEVGRLASESTFAVVEIASTGLRPRSFDTLAHSVHSPVLAVSGAQDSHVPTSWVLATARRYGWDAIVVPEGTHFVHIDRPQEWSDAVAGWLAA